MVDGQRKQIKQPVHLAVRKNYLPQDLQFHVNCYFEKAYKEKSVVSFYSLAEYLDVCYDTFCEWRGESQYSAILQKACDRIVSNIITGMLSKKSPYNTVGCLFWLKNQLKWRDRPEESGQDTIQTQMLSIIQKLVEEKSELKNVIPMERDQIESKLSQIDTVYEAAVSQDDPGIAKTTYDPSKKIKKRDGSRQQLARREQ